MLESPYVTSNDRQVLRDYYYQVKACTTWCVKMGQSAILQTPEYLSRATMRLPMNLRVRWYEHIDGRSGRSTLLEFEKWLCKRVDTLFNPLEDFICEEWNKKQKSTRPRSSLKLHPLATTTELPLKFQETAVTYLTSNKPVPNSAVKRVGTKLSQTKRGVLFATSNTVLPFVLFSSPSPCKKGGKLHGKMNFASIA